MSLCDIRRFTEISENVFREQWIAINQTYHDIISIN